MNRRLKSIMIFGMIGAFLAGLIISLTCPSLFDAVRKSQLRSDYEETSYSEAKIGALMSNVQQILNRASGLVPIDMYKELLKLPDYETVQDLMIHNGCLPMFDPIMLPVKVSTNFSANAKLILFYAHGPNNGRWIGLADGTVEYVDGTALGGRNLVAGQTHHFELLERAGYPRWPSRAEKEKWISLHINDLAWDENLRMYCVNP